MFVAQNAPQIKLQLLPTTSNSLFISHPTTEH